MNKYKLIWSSAVANTFEWYDYALFGHFASIIGGKFFPNSDPKLSTLHVFLVFAVGYMMRPLGGVFFGVIGDRFGRKAALSSAIICMSLPTAFIGILPTYDSIGITATIFMVIVRVLQGLSMGGALTGSISFLIEHTGKKHRGLSSSVSMSSICVGLLLGSAISYSAKYFLSAEQFNDWGWRLPFLFGIFIIFAGIYIKKHTLETPMFEKIKDSGNIAKSPIKDAFSTYWFDMLISILINSTGSVIFYLQTIYLISFLKINRGFHEDDITNLANYCYIIMAIATLLAGWISDIIGRKQIFIITLVMIMVITPFLMPIFESGDFVGVMLAQIALSVLAAFYIGPEPALQAEFYPTHIRSTALSISYNAATSIFGGLTPFIIESIVQKTGSIIYCVYYIIGCAILSRGALYFYKDRSNLNRAI
jgi:MHS family proline/betaine transporter-like MFS transporter